VALKVKYMEEINELTYYQFEPEVSFHSTFSSLFYNTWS